MIIAELVEERQKSTRQPFDPSGKTSAHEPDVAARGWELEHDCRGYLGRCRQMLAGQEGIVARVDHERGHADCGHQPLRARTGPVVQGVLKPVQRRGDGVVELAQRPRTRRRATVHAAGKPRHLRRRLALERAEKVPRVDDVEAALERVTGRGQVDGGRDRSGALEDAPRALALLAEPLE
jgi:hypothetical protein